MQEKDRRPGLAHKPGSIDNLTAELHQKLRYHSAQDTPVTLKAASSPASRSNSPTMSRQGSRVNLRGGSRPLLDRHRSSLADLAREHKLHSRQGSINDTRRYFMAEDNQDLMGHSYGEMNETKIDPNDDFVLLSSNTPELPQLNARSRSPDDPNFLFRTGSRLFTQAELELGDSSHNSPFASRNISLAASREASSDEESDFDNVLQDTSGRIDSMRAIQFHPNVECDYSALDTSESSDAEETRPYFDISSTVWSFVLGDVLGLDRTSSRSRSEKHQQREASSSSFDPAVALALFVSFVR